MAKTTIGKIPYSLGLRLSNPSEKDSAKKIFAYAQSQTINSRQLANHWASHTSSFSRGECLGIIEDLCFMIGPAFTQIVLKTQAAADRLTWRDAVIPEPEEIRRAHAAREEEEGVFLRQFAAEMEKIVDGEEP